MRKVVVETIEDEIAPPKPELNLPEFMRSQSEPPKRVRPKSPRNVAVPVLDEPLNFSELAQKTIGGVTGIRSIAMSLPAFLTIIVLLGALAYFAGRFTTSPDKKASAAPTLEPVSLGSSTPSPAPVFGTPDDIIKVARGQFASALEASKNPSQTDSQKEEISKQILGVLDELTQGITAYPNTASLYYERAQVEKMVMQSAPSLKTQADTDYIKALSLSPLVGDFYVGYADYYDVLGDKQKAIEFYEKAAQLSPKNLDALYPLAKLYAETSRNTEALAMYQKVSALLSPSSPQYTQIQQEMLALQPQMPVTPAASRSATPTASASAVAQ